MKSQKGVTLISLTIYVITMAVVIGILTTVTTYFYKNIKDVNVDIDPITQFTTFNSFFADEVNHSNLKVIECGKIKSEETESEQQYIVFSNGIQYTFVRENNGIYRDTVKICRNIEECTFSEKIENGKSVVTVYLKSGGKGRTVSYTLKN